MKIKIDNKNDLKKFYWLLFLYRSLIFRFVHFELEEDKYDVEPIVKALNIKNKKARITFIYQTACQQIDNYYQDKNICEFENNKCLAQRNSNKINGCCRICEYRTGGSCLVHNLACKLFYCDEVSQKHKILNFNDLPILKCLNKRQRFMIKSDYFSLEKDVINDLYYGILIGTVRVSYRFLRTIIKNKKRYDAKK